MTITRPNVVYTASATTSGGREGHAASSDGRLELDLAVPQEMGGTGEGTNPEQLFAVGWSACFNSALVLIARRAKVDAAAAQVTAYVGMVQEGGAFGLTGHLEVSIPGLDLPTVQQLADAAHEVCPYSRAVRGNIPVSVEAVAA